MKIDLSREDIQSIEEVLAQATVVGASTVSCTRYEKVLKGIYLNVIRARSEAGNVTVEPQGQTPSIRKVPSDGITFHICEVLGGKRVGVMEAHRALEKAAMTISTDQTRARLADAVKQGWAHFIPRDLDTDRTDVWDIDKLDLP